VRRYYGGLSTLCTRRADNIGGIKKGKNLEIEKKSKNPNFTPKGKSSEGTFHLQLNLGFGKEQWYKDLFAKEGGKGRVETEEWLQFSTKKKKRKAERFNPKRFLRKTLAKGIGLTRGGGLL